MRPRRRWLTHLVVAGTAVLVSVAATLAVTRPGTTSAGTVQESRPPEALVALSADGVRSYDPATGKWTQLGGPAESVHGGQAGLVAVAPGVRHVARYRTPGHWSYIGEPPSELAVGREHVYRLAADRASVWAWSDREWTWELAGGPALHLFAGGAGMFASSPDGHTLLRYEGTPGAWTPVTDAIGPDDTIVVGTDTLYRLPADRDAVLAWQEENSRWIRIGGPARSIHAGGAGLFMIAPDGGLHAYRNGSWPRIGDGGADIAVGHDHVYRRMADGTLARWTLATSTWTDLEVQATAITTMGT